MTHRSKIDNMGIGHKWEENIKLIYFKVYTNN